MARALSRTKKKTVIIDLCRAGSSLEALLGTAAGPGIADLVSGAAEFTKVMARDSRSPVHLLRYGQDRSEWAMGLVEQHIESVLQALENAYDMLIVHAGEVVNETPGLIRQCHAALVLAPLERGNDVAVAIDALSTGALRDAKYVVVEESASASGMRAA
jgi:Mrp family chromosome partitioning ATPase